MGDLADLQREILARLGGDEDDEPDQGPGPRLVELTAKDVLQLSEESSLEEVAHLVFRNQKLKSLSSPRAVDFNRLLGLEVLSLSHNLLSDITPLNCLVSLTELNLNFNQVVDLSPICDIDSLERLFASNNRIESVEGLDALVKLRSLSLYANRISDLDEVLETLQELSALRSLDLGENSCVSAPSRRYRLLNELTELEEFDGQPVGPLERQLADKFLDRDNDEDRNDDDDGEDEDEDQDAEDSVASDAKRVESRPLTAPGSASSSSRPPLPPSSGGALSSSLGVGQKLRSSLSNRMDDLLTSRDSRSRDPSPLRGPGECPSPLRSSRGSSPERSGSAELAMPPIDFSNPQATSRLLMAHAEALRLRHQSVMAERENLRFQVRLQQRETPDERLADLRRTVSGLEQENMNLPSIEAERTELQARIERLDRQVQQSRKNSGGSSSSSHLPDGVKARSDSLPELKWENHLLKKRLNRMLEYVEQMRRDTYSTRLGRITEERQRTRPITADPATLAADMQRQQKASAGSGDDGRVGTPLPDDVLDEELKGLLEENEEYLVRLRCDVVRVATAAAGGRAADLSGVRPAALGLKTTAAASGLPRDGRSRAQDGAVDVLVIGQGAEEDKEWHK